MYSIIDKQLSLSEFTTFDEFSAYVLSENKGHSRNATLAFALRASSIGAAFTAAYRCALQALLPELDPHLWAALCVTEKQGNHPKQIETVVNDQGLINGHKSFVSMAAQAAQLIVIAKAGQVGDRPILKAVKVKQPADGLQLALMPALPMIPEVSHGQITFNNVQGEILAGDGFLKYSKAFRYLEDLHVLIAFTGLVLSKSIRHELQPHLVEQTLLLLSSLMQLSIKEGPLQHLQLAASFAAFAALQEEFELSFSVLPDTFTSDWMRDKKLFSVANKARLSRRDKARLLLSSQFKN